MCKINGHSLFTYIAQPWDTGKLATSKKNASKIAKAQAEADALDAATSNSELNAETTNSIKPNDDKKNNLSSLRIPLKINTTGANTANDTKIGLNLGG